MSDFGEDMSLESDGCADFTNLNNRLQSFRGSALAQQVPPERLARAGFFFTGDADRVKCFSCRQTVENWCREDTPVERHKEISPSCKFLQCCHNNSLTSTTGYSLIYDEGAEDARYRLATGEVVDQTPYPKSPHMKSEHARLQTFSSWPQNAHVRPKNLVQAGFYCLGSGDRVQCFCCGGRLNDWEHGDNPWSEHLTHFPNCFFILGHDVGNVPLSEDNALDEPMLEESSSGSTTEEGNMETFQGRLSSFAGVQHPVDPERLAEAGFYSTGQADKVICFQCGEGLKAWQPEEDPWVEHAKHFPGCSFLLEKKGIEFVNSIQLQGAQQSAASSQNNESPASEKEEDPLEKLRRLQREKLCKICMDRDVSIVLIPCGHMVSCKQCSEPLVKCPICCGVITQKIKTYIA